MPVWVPAELLVQEAAAPATPACSLARVSPMADGDQPPTPPAACHRQPAWMPSAALVAHVHTAVRAALADPNSIVRQRLQWLARAQQAGVTSSVRLHDIAPLMDGDVCLDNVVNNPYFDIRCGKAAVQTPQASCKQPLVAGWSCCASDVRRQVAA